MDIKRNKTKFFVSLVGIFWLVLIVVSPSYIEGLVTTIDPNFVKENGIIRENHTVNNAERFVTINDSELELDYRSFVQSKGGKEIRYANGTIDNKKISNATNLIVLNYHGVYSDERGTGNTTKHGNYSLTYDRFKEHMFTLKNAGYETVGMKDLYSFLRGEKQLPEKSFVITFDDGIKDSYYNADPILKLLNYKATMFVIVYPSFETKSNYHLNKEELHQMQDTGRWELESHSYNAHRNIVVDSNGNRRPFISSKEWIIGDNRTETDDEYVNRIKGDYQTSKELLEREFNKTIIGFAFPFGEGEINANVDADPDEIISNIGESIYPMIFYQFRAATNTNFRANYNDQRRDSYMVKRISSDSLSAENLLGQMEASGYIDIPYDEKFDNTDRWVPLWGHDNIVDGDGNNLIVANYHNSPEGEMTYLDGSYPWIDYMFSGTIKENGSDNIFLLARFQDSQNYVACRFDNESVSIVNVVDKKSIDMSQKNLIEIYPLRNLTKLSISVIGNSVGCYINDKMETEKYVTTLPRNGGIGMKVEHISMNNSVKLGQIRVEYPYYGD